MQVIVVQVSGAAAFLIGSIWLGRSVRRVSDGRTAESASRASHLLFWCGLLLPGLAGLFYPGLAAYDRLLRMPHLPARPLWMGVGGLLLLSGALLMAVSNRFLMKRGRGAAAFLLTEHLVTDGLYGRTRNPMSLGFYSACTGIGLVAGSLAVTLGVLLIIVPVHVFNLRYFEERELELRLGPSYVQYKQRVPFLMPWIRRV